MNGRRIFYIRLWIRILAACHILCCVRMFFWVFGLFFFFLVIARCICRGLWDTAPTVGEAEPWSVFFRGVRQQQVLERGKTLARFHFPKFTNKHRKNNLTKWYFPTTLGVLLRLHLHDRAFYFPPSDTQQERDIIVTRIFPIQWNLSGLIK